MSFFNNIIESFTEKNKHGQEEERITETSYSSGGYGGGGYGGPQQGGYGGPQGGYGGPQPSYGGPQQGPPQPPYPWVARWDDRENRYIFINEQTGERSWNFPQQGGYGGGSGYGVGQSSYGGPQGGYGGGYAAPPRGAYEQETVVEEEHKKKGHGLAWGLGGAAVGLAGGALLMHEGEEMKQDWDADKYRLENDISNAPEDAAEWTGRKVGEVEDIPQDIEQGFDRFGDRIENKWDNAVDDVEDAPEDVANWAGRKVGDVERFGDDVDRFGDNMDNAYDAGRDEGRYDDY